MAPKPKADLYRDALPLLTSHRARLLDVPRLRGQLLGLERRTSRAGRDLIDHGPHGHDDCVNAALGSLLLAAEAGANAGVVIGANLAPMATRTSLSLLASDGAPDLDYEREAREAEREGRERELRMLRRWP